MSDYKTCSGYFKKGEERALMWLEREGNSTYSHYCVDACVCDFSCKSTEF